MSEDEPQILSDDTVVDIYSNKTKPPEARSGDFLHANMITATGAAINTIPTIVPAKMPADGKRFIDCIGSSFAFVSAAHVDVKLAMPNANIELDVRKSELGRRR